MNRLRIDVWPPVTAQSDTTVSITLVSNARLVAEPASPTGLLSLSGTVMQKTGSGRQPLVGLFVDFELVIFPLPLKNGVRVAALSNVLSTVSAFIRR